MQAVFDQVKIAEAVLERTNGSFGKRIGLFGKLFGCWHKEMSRPFTNRNASYRACLNCGARREFNAETLETKGPYYYPPAVAFAKN